uniref:uncharacterized protein LOC122585092 isoform X2 n=1 Tax=Erigeron canadensis TaxID=72917 RepID=UPI001CB9133C|nr:uncharacterized protein LOC122585092 isoform X2 [Erigeron canadensis]
MAGESKSMMEREIESMRVDLSDGEKVKSFVDKFPAQEQPLDCRALNVASSRRTFWNKTTTASKPRARRRLSSSSSSCCFDADGLMADADVWRRWRIHEKIKLAFSLFYAHHVPGLVQFWAPVNVGETKSSTTHSTSCQPFALDDLANPRLLDYRLFSTSYHCLPSDQSVVDDPLATAFLTRFPQVVLDLRKISHKGSPLVNKAIDCRLTCSILLPVFHHPLRRRSCSSSSSSSSSCAGVVECCIDAPSLLQPLLWFLNLSLKRVCLSTYPVQQHLTYQPSHGLCRAKDEIDKALKIVCESLRLNLAQVWIFDDSVSHVSTPSSSSSSPSLSPSPSPSSSLSLSSSSSSSTTSSEDTHLQTKQPGKYLVKFCGYMGACIARDADYTTSLNYCRACGVLPLKSEDSGFVGPTLATDG